MIAIKYNVLTVFPKISYLHCLWVELRTVQLLPSLSLMAHVVQVTLVWGLSHFFLGLDGNNNLNTVVSSWSKITFFQKLAKHYFLLKDVNTVRTKFQCINKSLKLKFIWNITLFVPLWTIFTWLSKSNWLYNATPHYGLNPRATFPSNQK